MNSRTTLKTLKRRAERAYSKWQSQTVHHYQLTDDLNDTAQASVELHFGRTSLSRLLLQESQDS